MNQTTFHCLAKFLQCRYLMTLHCIVYFSTELKLVRLWNKKKYLVVFCAIWYHLYNLKNVKNTHGGVLLLVKPATLLKVTLLHGCFLRFLNCTNGTKSRNASQCFFFLIEIVMFVTYFNHVYLIQLSFISSTVVHLIHVLDHSPSHSHLPYLVILTLHRVSGN